MKLPRTKEEKAYDDLYNEGQEGYNPYRNSAIPEDEEEYLSLEERLEKVSQEIERKCGWIARETYGNEYVDKLEKELLIEKQSIENHINEKFLSMWTLEITTERRKFWNDFINSVAVNGKISKEAYKLITQKEKELSWSINDLKKAVKLHNL